MRTDQQLLSDLLVLHGWLSDREGFPPAYAEAVAIATKRLFPKSTLSQGMENTLTNINHDC
jgi:hypothetical protein